MKYSNTNRPHRRKSTLLALVALAATLKAQAGVGELWEYTSTLQTGGMSMPIGKTKVCHSPTSALKPDLPKNCKLEQYSMTKNKGSFRAVCGPPEPSTMSGEMTRDGDTLTGTFHMQSDGTEMTMLQTARNLGACHNPID